MPLELKMKLTVTDHNVSDWIFNSAEFNEKTRGDFPPTPGVLHYYDTADGALQQRGWSLLLRDERVRHVAALRTEAADMRDSYLFSREEWQVVADTVEASIDLLVEDGAPRELYDILGGKPLIEQCHIDTMRRGRIIEPSEGLLIAVLEDVGTLNVENKSEPFHELEVSLLFGRAEELEPFVDRMFQEVPGLERARLSKYERALRLIRSRNR